MVQCTQREAERFRQTLGSSSGIEYGDPGLVGFLDKLDVGDSLSELLLHNLECQRELHKTEKTMIRVGWICDRSCQRRAPSATEPEPEGGPATTEKINNLYIKNVYYTINRGGYPFRSGYPFMVEIDDMLDDTVKVSVYKSLVNILFDWCIDEYEDEFGNDEWCWLGDEPTKSQYSEEPMVVYEVLSQSNIFIGSNLRNEITTNCDLYGESILLKVACDYIEIGKSVIKYLGAPPQLDTSDIMDIPEGYPN